MPSSDRRRARERAAHKIRTDRAKAIRKGAPRPTDGAPEGTPAKLRGINHPKMLAQRFKPGQSGNPAGRPTIPTLEEIMRKHLGGTVKAADGSDVTRLEVMAKLVFSEGVTKKNAKVLIALMDRLWPKPLKIIGDAENPIAVTQVTRRIIRESGD